MCPVVYTTRSTLGFCHCHVHMAAICLFFGAWTGGLGGGQGMDSLFQGVDQDQLMQLLLGGMRAPPSQRVLCYITMPNRNTSITNVKIHLITSDNTCVGYSPEALAGSGLGGGGGGGGSGSGGAGGSGSSAHHRHQHRSSRYSCCLLCCSLYKLTMYRLESVPSTLVFFPYIHIM